MRYELFIARRMRLGGGKGRTSTPSLTVATIGMVLAIVIMILSITIVTGFKHEISTRIYNIDSHIRVQNSGYAVGHNSVSASDIIPLVGNEWASVSLVAEKPAIFKTATDFKGIMYKGCGPDYDWGYLQGCLTEGRLPSMGPDAPAGEIIVSRSTASQLGLAVGDRIYTYFIDEKIKVRRSTVVGIYCTDFEEYDQAFVVGNIRAIQGVNGWDDDTGSYVGINTRHTDEIDNQAYEIFHRLWAAHSDQQGRPTYAVSHTHSNNVAYFSWLGLLDMNVVIIILLMAIVSAFTLVSALLMIVLERIRMIGILKTLGASNRSVRRIFIYLTHKLIVRAMVIGNVVSLAAALLQQHLHIVKLDPASYYMPYVPIEIDWGTIVLLNAGILVLSYLTLLLPSMIISKIEPSKTVNFE